MNRRSLLKQSLAAASGVVLAPLGGIPATALPEPTKVATKGILPDLDEWRKQTGWQGEVHWINPNWRAIHSFP